MRKVVFGLILAFGVSMFPAGAQADTVSDEASFVAKINDLRVSKGLPILVVNDNLVAKARSWAAGMAAAGRIWHSTLSDGITADWQKLGENVAAVAAKRVQKLLVGLKRRQLGKHTSITCWAKGASIATLARVGDRQ